jgi:hypothetical protein
MSQVDTIDFALAMGLGVPGLAFLDLRMARGATGETQMKRGLRRGDYNQQPCGKTGVSVEIIKPRHILLFLSYLCRKQSTLNMKTLPVVKNCSSRFMLACLLVAPCLTSRSQAAEATNSIVWHAESNTLDVDIDNKPLSVVVVDFKKATGREIHVPPGMTKTVSLKFADKPMSEGLARILDGFNYYGETHGNESRIVIVDPNAAPPLPISARPMPMPRPPSPTGVAGGNRPPGGFGGPGGPGGFSGNRGGDNRGGGTTTGDRSKKDLERQALEMIMREAGMSKGGSSDRGSGSSRDRSSGGGGSPSGKSKSPR